MYRVGLALRANLVRLLLFLGQHAVLTLPETRFPPPCIEVSLACIVVGLALH